MELNRNHYFLVGLVILLIGIQFRMVDNYVLNENTSRFLAERFAPGQDGALRVPAFLAANGPTPRKVVRPPQWLGWAAMSVGSVLILHSLAMKRPG